MTDFSGFKKFCANLGGKQKTIRWCEKQTWIDWQHERSPQQSDLPILAQDMAGYYEVIDDDNNFLATHYCAHGINVCDIESIDPGIYYRWLSIKEEIKI